MSGFYAYENEDTSTFNRDYYLNGALFRQPFGSWKCNVSLSGHNTLVTMVMGLSCLAEWCDSIRTDFVSGSAYVGCSPLIHLDWSGRFIATGDNLAME